MIGILPAGRGESGQPRSRPAYLTAYLPSWRPHSGNDAALETRPPSMHHPAYRLILRPDANRSHPCQKRHWAAGQQAL